MGLTREKARQERKKELLGLESGTIEFRSYLKLRTNSRYTAPINPKMTVYPKKDRIRNWYKGVEQLTEEEKKSTLVYVNPRDKDNPLSYYELEHGKTMDLSIPENKLILNWLLECDNALALTYDESKNSKVVRFYIHNEKIENKNRRDRINTIDSAVEELKRLAGPVVREISLLLGFNRPNTDDETLWYDLRDWLNDPSKAYDNSKKFLSTINDPQRKVKHLLLNAIRQGIITINREGHYMWEDSFLGETQARSIAWLQDNKNVALVRRIKAQVIGEEVEDDVPTTADEELKQLSQEVQEQKEQTQKRGRPKKS